MILYIPSIRNIRRLLRIWSFKEIYDFMRLIRAVEDLTNKYSHNYPLELSQSSNTS